MCGAIVKAAYCLHRLRRHNAAAAALELVGCRCAAAVCYLHAAVAANDDNAEEGTAGTAAASLAAASAALRGNGSAYATQSTELSMAAAAGERRGREAAIVALASAEVIDWTVVQRVAHITAAL